VTIFPMQTLAFYAQLPDQEPFNHRLNLRQRRLTSVKMGADPATTYVWGPRNQLASVSSGSAFEYDSAGHRTARTNATERIQYVWDGDNLMSETNRIGNPMAQYTRAGNMLLGEVRNGAAQHFDLDGFNSVILTTLENGTVPGRLSYRAFGAIRASTGIMANPFRFNGYVSDGSDELSSPSRYYSIGTGRFTSMDPATPLQMDPMTWNAYVGLNSNPMVFTDPTGRYGEGGHYYATLYVALKLGIPAKQAQRIAFFSQLPDEADATDAIAARALTSRAELSSYTFNFLATREKHTKYMEYVDNTLHVLTGKPGGQETQRALAAIRDAGSDADLVGLLIHPLGDSIAHRDASEPHFSRSTDKTFSRFGFGHGPEGHVPDVIQRYSGNFGEHADNLIEALSAFGGLRHNRVDSRLDEIHDTFNEVANSGNLEMSDEELDREAISIFRGKIESELEKRYTTPEDKKLIASIMAYHPEKVGSSMTQLVLNYRKPVTLQDALRTFELWTGNGDTQLLNYTKDIIKRGGQLMQRHQENGLPFPEEVIEELENQSGFIRPGEPIYDAYIRSKIEEAEAEIAKESASAPGAIKEEK
jgi:RHS repeat-associated protein